MKFEFEYLRSLLRRPLDDLPVLSFIGGDPSVVERDDYYGSVLFNDAGVDMVLNEAPFVLPAAEVTDPTKLYVCAFHFHRQGHEDFEQYGGELPGGVLFGESEADVRRRLGDPSKEGGGGTSPVLQRPIGRWIQYVLDHDALLHLQFDKLGTVEMVTLQSADRWK